MGLFIFFVVAICLIWALADHQYKKENQLKVHHIIQRDLATGTEVVTIDWPAQFQEIEKAITQNNYDFAKLWLQKFAYTITGNDDVSQEVKDEFKRVMTRFASEEPFYNEVIVQVVAIVKANPGIVQSKLYKEHSAEIKEKIRYVLYFAHEEVALMLQHNQAVDA